MGDTFALYPLFTKKANQEAMEQMNPRKTHSMWTSPTTTNSIEYGVKLDGIATIFTATKE